jgi:AcrR family transcriptional regulator
MLHAMRLADAGRISTVAELAAAAGVSRATAYRYFPSRSRLVAAIVEESLGPMRHFESRETAGRPRLLELFRNTFPRFKEYEPQMRAALQLSLEHWALERSGQLDEEPYRRGHRAGILDRAAAPLKAELGRSGYARLVRALSLIYGIEPYVVLKDIWGASDREVESIAHWAAEALIDAALRAGRSAARNGGKP